ncbi:MAG TPA: SUF system NifU family Fe-S cluster assembly protein [Gammaproteobacteria bacterium]
MDLKDLYQDLIVDHNRRPRNFRRMEDADRRAEGFNPLCGDKLTLFLKLDEDAIEDVSFQGSGCAISVASASLLTERLKGMKVDEAEELFGDMIPLLTGKLPESESRDRFKKLAALEGVKDYPSRVKCASLCWHTLDAALKNADQPVTTE